MHLWYSAYMNGAITRHTCRRRPGQPAPSTDVLVCALCPARAHIRRGHTVPLNKVRHICAPNPTWEWPDDEPCTAKR